MKISSNTKIVIEKLQEVKRKGMSNLIVFLVGHDYFSAPASSKYHLSEVGGLVEHSINVYNQFHNRNKDCKLNIPQESVIIAGLLHDVCKCKLYNKTEDGYKVNKKISKLGHADLSLAIIEKFITLTPLEKALIKYHMGIFGATGKYAEYTPEELMKATIKFPAVQIFASCDMEATQMEGQ